MTDTESLVELDIGGMTCASCANRVERKLNKLEGVTARVNYATERATVGHGSSVSLQTLVDTVAAAGYSAAERRPEASGEADDAERIRRLRNRVLISAALTVPVVLLAMVGPLQFSGWEWVSLALALPVVAWGGAGFHRAAAVNARHGAATMDTLVSMGTLAAMGWSIWALLFRPDGGEHVYFEAATAITVFILLGRYLEHRAKRSAGASLRALLEVGAKDVAVLHEDGSERRLPVGLLAVGDRFVVRPGEKVAADGRVEQGSSAVDTSALTGESVPVEVGTGDEVLGGSLNASGRLVVRAARVGNDTQVGQMARIVEEAQASKASAQRLADRISGVFVPVVIGLAAVTLAAWLLADGTADQAFTAAVAVLIIACPCALGLATPMALMVGTGAGARRGILIRNQQTLETARRVDTVVFDKTGTLTTGRMAVAGVVAAEGAEEAEVLRVAAALESGSEHPVARAIVEHADLGPDRAVEIDDFTNHPGLGVSGRLRLEGDGALVEVLIGRPALLSEEGTDLSEEILRAQQEAADEGRTAVLVAWGGVARGVISVGDRPKPTGVEAVARVRALGLTPMLLTGDGRAAAESVAQQVGIEPDDVIAEVLPAEKADRVRELQAQGRAVAMVGDGVNDSAALAVADLGVAMGTGTDAAIEAADLTIVSGDPASIAEAISLSRRTLSVIRSNLGWAFGYNVVALPLAAFGLLNPMIAGAAMALSSVSVVANSLRLRR